MGRANGVLGPIESEDLGFTLMHEHILICNWSMRQRFEDWIDIPEAIQNATEEVTQAQALGVGTLVDMTPINLGRDVHVMREVAEREKTALLSKAAGPSRRA